MRNLTWMLLLTACSSPGGPGDECACTSDCEDGLYCTPEAEEPLDIGSSCDGDPVGQCTPYQSEGATCDPVQDVRCEPGLLCNRGFTPAKCLAESAEGEPCYYSHDCEVDLVCNHATSPPECRTPGVEGDPCAGVYEEECSTGLVCDVAADPRVCATI